MSAVTLSVFKSCLSYNTTGVKLEFGPNQVSNNTLITVDNIGPGALVCSTDCCTDEFSIAGNWFLPNGSKVSSSTSTQSLHIMLGNQTVGLNFSNSDELPTTVR